MYLVVRLYETNEFMDSCKFGLKLSVLQMALLAMLQAAAAKAPPPAPVPTNPQGLKRKKTTVIIFSGRLIYSRTRPKPNEFQGNEFQ